MERGLGGALIRKAMTMVAIACCLSAMTLACARRDGAVTADGGPPDSTVGVDTLIVGLDEARRIADFPGLKSDPALDLREPRGRNQHDSRHPQQCWAHFDQGVAFGGDWTGFRSVTYSGSKNYGISQAVAVYPDESASRAALDRLESAFAACSGLHTADFPLTVRRKDSSSIALCSRQCAIVYRVKSSVLMNVSVQRFPTTAERIADSFVQTIADRIPTS